MMMDDTLAANDTEAYMAPFRSFLAIINLIYVVSVVVKKCTTSKGSLASPRFHDSSFELLIHIVCGIVTICLGSFLHLQNEWAPVSAKDDSNFFRQALYKIFGSLTAIHFWTTLKMVPKVMGERRITIPLYVCTAFLNLANAITLLLKPNLENTFVTWGSLSIFVIVRLNLFFLRFANVDWELAYTYSIVTSGAVTCPLTRQGWLTYYIFLLAPLLYGPFHERVCRHYGLNTEDTICGNKPAKKNFPPGWRIRQLVPKPKTVKTKWFHDFESKLPSLRGKTVVITGCTSGIGLVIAKTCVKKNAKHVLLLNRPSDRSAEAENMIKGAVNDQDLEEEHTLVTTIPCDLQDFDSVRKAASKIIANHDAIDVLCNNAGVMAMKDKATVDGYDTQMQTNHLGHFLLTKLLFPLLQRANELRGEARIVNHTSFVRWMPHADLVIVPSYLEKRGGKLGGDGNSMLTGYRWFRYQQSKLANAIFTKALAARVHGTGIKAVVAAPGMAATNLHQTSHVNGGINANSWVLRFSQSAEDASMPVLSACFDESTENGDFWEPSKMFRLYGPATKVKWDKPSESSASQIVLWQKSEEACGAFSI